MKVQMFMLLLALSARATAQETVNYINESDLNNVVSYPDLIKPGQVYTIYQRNYSYDNAGNRITRTPLIMHKPEIGDSLIHNFYINVGDKQVAVRSNGKNFEIDMNTWDNTDHGDISVFTTGGQTVMGKSIESVSTDVDLNSQPNGVYLISVAVNEDRKTVAVTNKQ